MMVVGTVMTGLGTMVGTVAVMTPLYAMYILRDISQLIYTCYNYVSNYYESHNNAGPRHFNEQIT